MSLINRNVRRFETARTSLLFPRRVTLSIYSFDSILLLLLALTNSWLCVDTKFHGPSNYGDIIHHGRHYRHSHERGNWTEVGISPPILNLATKAYIEANATCGEDGSETYCKLVEHVYRQSSGPLISRSCQVCDAHSSDKGKRHPINYTIDGSNRWWQSPTLQNGRQYEWITITIDLRQIYQVAYIIIKAAISPNPGNWILERSLDGYVFSPWQYYAISDEECWSRYRIRAKPGKPSYDDDEEVICTSYYSHIPPFEGGEIHTSLVNGRPGLDGPSEALIRFTLARYVRLRLQKIRTLHADLMHVSGPDSPFVDKTVLRRYFYSIKDISIGGRCVCFGHANECVMDAKTQSEKCLCRHNTCGHRCDICCPLFNQYPWGAGNSTNSATCERCQCYGHADSCVYDEIIHAQRLSINIHGEMDGGGVCLDCKHFTAGINCEKCQDGYFRPAGVRKDHPRPCVKCDCDPNGSIGECVPDEDQGHHEGKNPGDCYCKSGYEGRRCDRCAMGFKGFPRCVTCPCHIAGIVNTDCEGACNCKANVEGSRCSECKKGFFNLLKENSDGCTQCFCHGVTSQCTSSDLPVVQIPGGHNWFVTDLHGTKSIPATQIGSTDRSNIYQIANEEFSSISEYYWMPITITGNKIHSYGLNVTFQVSWTQARGDTSGRPIPAYDVIIQGQTTMLGFNKNAYDGDNATVTAVLNEANCRVLPDMDNNVVQSPRTPSVTACTRYDVMEALSNIKKVLLRAKFHTDQIEGILRDAYLETALTNATRISDNRRKATSVEICQCPQGYRGTSCEQCEYGYRKLNQNSWLTECVKCDCNGHSSSCDSEGNCVNCDHNTTGKYCQFCERGFYGDPTKSESAHVCKRCECPLGIPENNFSPLCELQGHGYVCTACPHGTEGEFCERCSNGFYGNPAQPGDFCKPCQCTGVGEDAKEDICDHLTGECLVCSKNTVGWNCDECVAGHYGNPLNGSCAPCDCDALGCVISTTCHQDSGQCQCRENFVGRRCDKCLEGHANPLEGCPNCKCNLEGSLSTQCDTLTGQCTCKPGVGGRYCNKCLENYFGFSSNGCAECDCSVVGADSDVCDLNTGQCHCLPHVRGRKCDECKPGWWNFRSGRGCDRCNCDPLGSTSHLCDLETGQCPCKDNVAGRQCNVCFGGHYGMTQTGCKVCDPCDKPGFICDPISGRCACPPNTEGDMCEKCIVGFWGHQATAGCQPCNCSQQGSIQPQCAPDTGKCVCELGFAGDKCDRCRFGHFNYPLCTPCNCDPLGTVETSCEANGTCSCSSTGQCHCKANVTGLSCDRCSSGYYGLEKENPEGCMQCFCFQRTNKCSQGYFKWQRFAMPASNNEVGTPLQNNDQLRLNDLLVIPETARDVIVVKDISFGVPLFWQLPHIFLGDKVLSYNGFLRFHTHAIAVRPFFPTHVLATYPLIQIQGNHRLILQHFSKGVFKSGFYEVKLHEDDWRLKNGPNHGIVSKEVMMVALQNLQHVLIRATYSPEIYNATLFNVSLDIAIPSSKSKEDKGMAHGIEVCDCPPEYNSTSCQNPRVGFYRWYKRDYITSTVIIDLIGEARRCECNGRATSCDTETGWCKDCRENTSGPHCDTCKEGHYGNPNYDHCYPCPCPKIGNNHAKSCFKLQGYHYMGFNGSTQFHCECLKGYTGIKCDRCDYGFYGKPWEIGGHCTPCKCNIYGSVSDECDEITGQCNCRAGVTGRDCGKCQERHVITSRGCTSCADRCSGVLLSDLDLISWNLTNLRVDPTAVRTWKKLRNMDTVSAKAKAKFETIQGISRFLDDVPQHQSLAGMLTFRMGELAKQCEKAWDSSAWIVNTGTMTLGEITQCRRQVQEVINSLLKYANDKVDPQTESEWARREASGILGMLEDTSERLKELTADAEMELEDVNELFDVLLEKLNSSGGTPAVIAGFQEKLRELKEWLSQVDEKLSNTAEVMTLSQRLFKSIRDTSNVIDDSLFNIEMKEIESETKLTEGSYLETELEQVMLQIEDMLRDFRNTTKELEIKDNILFDTVPHYRALYAQPAFDHELELNLRARYIQGLFDFAKLNSSAAISAVREFSKMKDAFLSAFELVTETNRLAKQSGATIQELLSTYNIPEIAEKSTTLMDLGVATSISLNNRLKKKMAECESRARSLTERMNAGIETLNRISFNLDGILEQDMKLDEFLARIMEISTTASEVMTMVMEAEQKIQNEIKVKLDGIKLGGGGSLGGALAVIQMSHAIPEIVSDVASATQRQQKMSTKRESLEDKTHYLKALIKQARHKSNSVGVSLGPNENGTCTRVFSWPPVDSATLIVFNFAPVRPDDSLIFYWPSRSRNDFISIEMINLHIKVSWDLGSGLRTLIHQTKLSYFNMESDDPDNWYEIRVERVGSSVTLNVVSVSIDPTSPTTPRTTPVKYANQDEEATLLDISPFDPLFLGGMTSGTRPGLVDNGLFSGCIHNLRLNHQSVGLWNFLESDGCAPCVQCPTDPHLENMPASGELEYYFDGRGYSVMSRIKSQTFHHKAMDVSLEFKTFAENGLLFLTVNETLGQFISLELREGNVIMQVRHRWGDIQNSLHVQGRGSNVYNTGEWIVVRGIWVFQKGSQIAKLIVGQQDFTQKKSSPSTLTLKLYEAKYQIGGVFPTFAKEKWSDILTIVPYVGCMKNILVDGSTYDPMSDHYFGVQTPCSGRSVFLISFEGDGFSEFGSRPIERNFKLGFSFKTTEPTGLLLLSTFAKSVESPDEHYYAVMLQDGHIRVQIGVPQGPFDLSGNGSRLDDGAFHSLRFVKKNRKLFLFIDDEEVMDVRLSKQDSATVNAPRGRGLFLGGTTSNIERKFQQTPLPVYSGFKGCIRNFYFGNELLDFNYPVAHKNLHLGQCIYRDESLSPQTRELVYESSYDRVAKSMIVTKDPECVSPDDSFIEDEGPAKTWHFGDEATSHATLTLTGSRSLKQTFNVTFQFRTFYPNGMFFQGLKKRGGAGGYCLMSFLRDGQVIVKLYGPRSQDLVSSVSGLNDGRWHQVTVVKAEDKMYLYINGRNATQTQVPKIKPIVKMYIGGVPPDENDCLENSIHKPEHFKGCMRNFIVNSHNMNLDPSMVELKNVKPCVRNVETGTFFGKGSYAIYARNFSIGTLLEVELDFRSYLRNSVLFTLLPNESHKYPSFSIFLVDGKVVARETVSANKYYEAVANFDPVKGYICNGRWHNIRAEYDKGSITLRVDNGTPIFALADPEAPQSQFLPFTATSATIYIGGLPGTSQWNSKPEFHGCIRNIVLNREIRDWTDMPLIHNAYLNSCPT